MTGYAEILISGGWDVHLTYLHPRKYGAGLEPREWVLGMRETDLPEIGLSENFYGGVMTNAETDAVLQWWRSVAGENPHLPPEYRKRLDPLGTDG